MSIKLILSKNDPLSFIYTSPMQSKFQWRQLAYSPAATALRSASVLCASALLRSHALVVCSSRTGTQERTGRLRQGTSGTNVASSGAPLTSLLGQPHMPSSACDNTAHLDCSGRGLDCICMAAGLIHREDRSFASFAPSRRSRAWWSFEFGRWRAEAGRPGVAHC